MSKANYGIELTTEEVLKNRSSKYNFIDFVNLISNDDFNKIRNSKSDAEARRVLKTINNKLNK